jgi:hypothetical protein
MNMHQKYNQDGVREQRSDYNHKEVSNRHREFFDRDCPCTDVDYLLAEYDLGWPAGLADLKNIATQHKLKLHSKSHLALMRLANYYAPDGIPSPLPFWVAVYCRGSWSYRIWPMNDPANEYFCRGQVICERDYFLTLTRIRNDVRTQNNLPLIIPPQDKVAQLNTSLSFIKNTDRFAY